MSAIISSCGRYRYVLTRSIPQPIRWNKRCLFVMLNPSTADATQDDPTIRRCLGFAKREGCTSLSVVNLFAYRATHPDELLALDPRECVGPDNDLHIRQQIAWAMTTGIIVAAWGSHKAAKVRSKEVGQMLGESAVALKINGDGQPAHPLYLAASTPLVPFPWWRK